MLTTHGASDLVSPNAHSFSEATRFIDTINGNTDGNCIFQVFYDDQMQKNKYPAKVLQGTLKKHFTELLRLNRLGYGIFLCINECTGSKRKKENITKVRAVFFEDDKNRKLDLPLQPSLSVQSARGQHGYYLLKETIPLEHFTPLQTAIASALGTDPTIKDLPRVMRIPGFYHVKDPAKPKYVHITEISERKYSLAEILQAFKIDCINTNEVQLDASPTITNEYIAWSETMSAEEGADNKYGGRNKTALIIVREGFGQKQSVATIKQALDEYCKRSGLEPSEVSDMLEKQSHEHDIKKFKSYFDKQNQKKISAANLANEYLIARGHCKYGSQATFAYWRANFYEYMDTHYKKIEDVDLEADLIGFLQARADAREKFNSRLVSEIRNHLKGARHITANIEPGTHQQDAHALNHYICLKNIILFFDKKDPSNKQILEHDPRLFSLGAINCDYQPTTKCPQWFKFLEDVLPDKYLRDLIQEWFGLNLIYETSYAKCLILTGAGANGKTVITTVLATLLGSQNVSSVPLEAMDPKRTFPLVGTIGKLANIVDEMSSMSQIAEGTLKQFISGSQMTMEEKGKPAFQTKPTARLTCATNSLPRISDRSDGLWRRLLIVPMNLQILDESKQNKNLINPLFWERSGELSGIFNWSLQGLERLIKRGHFDEPASSKELKNEYRKDSDHVGQFFTESLDDNAAFQVGCTVLYNYYVDYAQELGVRSIPNAAFARALMAAFPNVTRSLNPVKLAGDRRERVWIGLKLNSLYGGGF